MIKLCGVQLGNTNYVSATWESVWGKFRNVIKLNKLRNLRLFGKSVIVNTLALSTLWYVASVFPIDPYYIHKFNFEMFSFI